MDMLKEPKSRKTDSLVSYKDDHVSKEIQVNVFELPALDDEEDLIIRHQDSYEKEIADYE